MKEFAAFHSALKTANHESAKFMTAHTRAEAHNSGWPAHLTNSLRVNYTPEGFKTHSHSGHHTEVTNLEYGLPGKGPNAALRRSANKMGQAESFLLKRLEKHMGEL
jgi:hypothetical protein